MWLVVEFVFGNHQHPQPKQLRTSQNENVLVFSLVALVSFFFARRFELATLSSVSVNNSQLSHRLVFTMLVQLVVTLTRAVCVLTYRRLLAVSYTHLTLPTIYSV